MERQRQRLRAPMAASWLYSRSITDVSLCPDTKNQIGFRSGKICGEAAVSGTLKYKPNFRVRAAALRARAGTGLLLGAMLLSVPAASALHAQTAPAPAEPAPAGPTTSVGVNLNITPKRLTFDKN